MRRLIDALVDRICIKFQRCPYTRRHRRPQVGNVIDLVLVKGNGLSQIDLNFIGGRYIPCNSDFPSYPFCCATLNT